ncbi:N-acetyl-D-Glu racemase DgcA [Aurantimonas sp. Leaf443]|uniref:N-acetyl-D-Glu racemase DgcA n=1 Tax=Aurantimonas sp. Leaf443 TaxID=1736378 RepID=UPI0007007345|nr:N-acetyl-D-Glu racemase DgcA [Aurantimonas sp. Leaf443]KQT86223.1 mandelate racemase [Aurantimonas sp. Leaf443]
MSRGVSVTVERFALEKPFRIARGTKTEAAVVTCTLGEGGATGRGECVPYARYGESLEGVTDAIEAVRGALEAGAGRDEIATLLPPGAARNAVDCALWDLEAKTSGMPVWRRVCGHAPAEVETAYTISLGTPEEMAAATAEVAHRTLLKIKLGSEDDASRIRAVRAAAPRARLILDANEGWTEANLLPNMLAAARAGASLVEQPLPAGRDALLGAIPHPVPVCADESVHVGGDLSKLVGRYDVVNVKLDKTGGLTEGLALMRDARALGFGVMVGCMVGTSLAMAPALLLAQEADFVDLDGPLLLRADRPNGLVYRDSRVAPPISALWG